MSEYQRYEFMTIDQPLTPTQLDEVNTLSSHIEASSTHAIIEYHWGDFKHDPVDVLHKFFDGFLYWANWGSPRLAFRFPHGTLPADLIDAYDFDDLVIFTRHREYDILDIHFGELESPDMWTEYELGSLIRIREELLDGDLRALYIAWLASQEAIWGYDEDEIKTEDEEDEHNAPPVPPALAKLTAAQQALVDLLQVPQELVVAAARHSSKAVASSDDDFAAWIKLLPAERGNTYLLRLVRNEPGLNRLLVKELRGLGKDKRKATPSTAEHVPYVTLLTESKTIKTQLAREKLEQEQLAHQRHLQSIHDRQDEYWQQVDQAIVRGSGTGYDEAVHVLSELREVANTFKEASEFQERFRAWARPHLRRPALVKRLQKSNFTLPEA
jgi:hypothetical protein